MVRLADQSFVVSLQCPTTNLYYSRHRSDTIFSTCAVYHRHNTGRRPVIIINNNNMSILKDYISVVVILVFLLWWF